MKTIRTIVEIVCTIVSFVSVILLAPFGWALCRCKALYRNRYGLWLCPSFGIDYLPHVEIDYWKL